MKRQPYRTALAPLALLLAMMPMLLPAAQALAEEPPWGALGRFWHAYADELVQPAAENPAPAPETPLRRGLAAPLASPPFPSADYIGLLLGGPYAPTAGPLMQALSGTAPGRLLEQNRISAYGWLSGAFNGSTSARLNAPLGYDYRANRPELNQALLRLERLPDTAQTDHVDWGFRVDGLYGLDYRYTIAKGVLSDQLLRHNRTYGFDAFTFFGEVYLPRVAEGMTVRFGRFATLPDVESVTAPDNYLHSHSMLNTYDAYTQFGVLTTTRLNRNFSLTLGLSAGNDIMPGVPGAKPTLTGCLRATTDSNNDSHLSCVSSLGNSRYAYGNVQNAVAHTWTHRFSERLHTSTELAYLWQTGVPGIGFAASKAAVNFLALQVSDVGRVVLRNELFDDRQGGQRSGFASRYSTHTLGYGHTLSSTLVLRPEVRFDHAYDARAYDGGRSHNQVAVLLNLLVRI
jgi:hypothetical protein